MLKTTLTLAAVSLALMLSTSVSADEEGVEYLGPHTTVLPAQGVNGGEGVLFYNDLCAAEFDDAQMCESIDVLRSGSPVPPGPSVRQWIRPTLLPPVQRQSGQVVTFDASGISVSSSSGNLSCFGWSNSGGVFGLVLFGTTGRFGFNACSAFLAVACCKVGALDDDDDDDD